MGFTDEDEDEKYWDGTQWVKGKKTTITEEWEYYWDVDSQSYKTRIKGSGPNEDDYELYWDGSRYLKRKKGSFSYDQKPSGSFTYEGYIYE